jgi:hypothetical protein
LVLGITRNLNNAKNGNHASAYVGVLRSTNIAMLIRGDVGILGNLQIGDVVATRTPRLPTISNTYSASLMRRKNAECEYVSVGVLGTL